MTEVLEITPSAGQSQIYRTPLRLDLTIGGNGDNWMRLASLYTAAALRPAQRIVCTVPKLLRSLAPVVFGDRIEFEEKLEGPALIYTNRGLKDLLPQAMRGERFVVPYHRVVTRDWNTHSAKDSLNTFGFTMLNMIHWTQLPPWPALDVYQGYLEVVSIAALRNISWDEFLSQAGEDYDVLFRRLSGKLSNSPELVLPPDIAEQVTVFPSGTGHQFMPVEWAVEHLPHAYYCFYHKDPQQNLFAAAGLPIIHFFNEPTDIITIAQQSRMAITTDSFASHLLQYSTDRVVLALAELPRIRVVSPFFRGIIVDSAAPCSPCPHLERNAFPKCKAGYDKCLSWESIEYTQQILDAVYH